MNERLARRLSNAARVLNPPRSGAEAPPRAAPPARRPPPARQPRRLAGSCAPPPRGGCAPGITTTDAALRVEGFCAALGRGYCGVPLRWRGRRRRSVRDCRVSARHAAAVDVRRDAAATLYARNPLVQPPPSWQRRQQHPTASVAGGRPEQVRRAEWPIVLVLCTKWLEFGQSERLSAPSPLAEAKARYWGPAGSGAFWRRHLWRLQF